MEKRDKCRYFHRSLNGSLRIKRGFGFFFTLSPVYSVYMDHFRDSSHSEDGFNSALVSSHVAHLSFISLNFHPFFQQNETLHHTNDTRGGGSY